MEKLTSILVPFDFSESARTAIEYAINFVGRQEIEINVLHMTENGGADDAKKAAEEMNEKFGKHLKKPMRWVSGRGSLTETILETREKKKTEMIIMGTSGLSETEEMTHTAELVAAASCPVLVVPENTEKRELLNICLVLGKDEIDEPKSLHTLLEIARLFNARVHVLTIKNTDETIGYSDIDEKNENTLMYYLESFYAEHTYLENEDIVKGIFSYADSHEIDMIALLPRNHVKHGTPTGGLLTRELVFHSSIPVLTVH